MRRQVYLESAAATKNGTRYSFDFRSRMERDFTAFQLRDAIAVHDNQETSAADSDSINMLSPYVWIKWDDTVKISPALITVGTDITQVVSNGDAGVTLKVTVPGITYEKIGESFACRSNVNWYNLIDSTVPNPAQNKLESTFVMIFETPAVLSSRYIWKDAVHWIKVVSGVINVRGIGTDQPTTVVVQPSTPYIIKTVWIDVLETMTITLINLLDNVEQSSSVILTGHTSGPLPTSTTHTISISDASTGFWTWTLGEVLLFNALLTPAAEITVTNYMKALYAGGLIGSALPVHSLTLHSEFLSQARHGKSIGKDTGLQLLKYDNAFTLDGALYHKDRSEKYECDNDRLDIIDLYFTKPDGTEVECDFSVCVDLFNDASQL